MNKKNDQKTGELEKRHWMVASTGLNTLLALAKLAWGIFTGSTIVLADAIHSISDVVGAALVYVAVRLAPHHSARFPLGLYKLEDMAAVVGGLGVLLAGYEILRSVFTGSGVTPPSLPIATLWFMVVVLIVQAVFYRIESRAAGKLHSPGLNSDVANWLGDMGAGLVVMAGIAGHQLGIPLAQEVAVIIITGFIFHSAYAVIRDGLLSLLDASTAKNEMEQARSYLEALPQVEKIHGLRIRRAGSALFLSATLEVEPKGFGAAHRLVDEISEELKRQIPRLESVTLHYEPTRNDLLRRVTLFEEDKITPATSFGKTCWLLLEEIREGESGADDGENRVESTQWFRNPYLGSDHGKAMKLTAWMVKNRIDEVCFTPDHAVDTLLDLFSTLGIRIGMTNPRRSEDERKT